MHPDLFQIILQRHDKIAIVGGPKTGKTTLARTVTDRPVHHNDAGKHIPWDAQPHFWMQQVAGQGKFVIDGVQAARAVRKGLPVDAIVHLDSPYEEQSPGQKAMTKGQHTIMKDVTDQNPHIFIYK